MYVVQINDGKVVDILLARKDADKGMLIAIDSIPVYEPKRGYRGVLKYNTEHGVYWDYEKLPEREATTEDYKTVYDELNHGQQKKIVRNEAVKAIFDRYGVVYTEAE